MNSFALPVKSAKHDAEISYFGLILVFSKYQHHFILDIISICDISKLQIC